MKKLGLDIGSSSIGWVIFNGFSIVKHGVIRFSAGMIKGDSGYSSPTKDRRMYRLKRNVIRARKYRKWELLDILIKNNMVPLCIEELNIWSKYQKGVIRKFPDNPEFIKWLSCDFSYDDGKTYKNPYELRVKALDNKLTNHEFGRVLYHIIQRRGYKDIGEKDNETKKQIKRRTEEGFDTSIQNHRTLAEALKNDFLDKGKRARNQYTYRNEYAEELELICKKQGYDVSKDEKGRYRDRLVFSLWKSIIWQSPLRVQKGNIGMCMLEPTRLRCPLSHPVFEIFRAWSFINTIMYFDDDNEKQPLSKENRKIVFEFLLKQDKNIKFEKIKEILDKQTEKPHKYNYISKEGKYDSLVSGMPICKGLINLFGEPVRNEICKIEKYDGNKIERKIIKSNIKNESKKGNNEKYYSIYDLWHFLFDFDEEYLSTFAQQNLGIANKVKKGKEFNPMVKIQDAMPKGYANLSLKAMRKIIPFLKEGYIYSDAVVLAKIPELLGTQWENNKELILDALSKSNDIYNHNKQIVSIVNRLINIHKGLPDEDKFAYKDYTYTIKSSDEADILNACENYFGSETWKEIKNKDDIRSEVKTQYQSYFKDEKRAYKKLESLTDTFKATLNSHKIEIKGNLYHHSNRKNIYNQNLETNHKTGEKRLPTRLNNGGVELEILPTPIINSIKNPMFNKAIGVLRKLLNELIINGDIDQDTEVIIELARELNDNNKRIAIERYQKDRQKDREKIRSFLKEYKETENKNFDIEEKIPVFELWAEQIFAEPDDEKKHIIKKKEILSEKDRIERYNLWMEQKCQCMYTGKMISIGQLFSGETDIEHTIPRSKLPDNTMPNKTIAFKRYNEQIKKDKLPSECPNYGKDTPEGTDIIPRLEKWKKLRDRYQYLYDSRKKAKGKEDENTKNKRIQEKHYYKMYLDYWNDKLSRFEAIETKDSWVRRQLVDTQIISKYAREFLKLYFKKVFVQKGTVTAEFRKILGTQNNEAEKDRSKHTHHTIDALILTLIPTNSSYRENIIKEYYYYLETKDKLILSKIRKNLLQKQNIKIQSLLYKIENQTLVYNYEKDTLLQQTSKNIRNRGKIQYVRDKQGRFILDASGKPIPKKAKGSTVRGALFKDTYIGKIRDVQRDDNGKPIRENGDWKYKTGKEEFIFVVRKPIEEIKSKPDKIIDHKIKEIVKKNKGENVILDYQNKPIRHVRIKTKAAREVKDRVNYLSKHDYKNKLYSTAGSIPYAILLQKTEKNQLERELITVPLYKIAKVFREKTTFDIKYYINEFYPEFKEYNAQLIKVGQKILVLKSESEYSHRNNIDFQQKRLYVITKLEDERICLQYHLEAQSKNEIEHSVKNKKHNILYSYEKKVGLPEIKEDENIEDKEKSKKDYENRKYNFKERLAQLAQYIGQDETTKIKQKLDQYKVEPAILEYEGKTPLLKMTRKNWNFLYEGVDFDMDITGKLSFRN